MTNPGLIAAALLLSVSGCSIAPSTTEAREGSALDLGSGEGSICIPRGGEEPKTFGAIAIQNLDDSPVTLTGVKLTQSKGLELVGTRVFPGEDKQLVADGWPPYGKKWRRQYDAGSDAAGTEVAPGDTISLWVGVNAPTGDGSAGAARVEYETADGDRYWQDTVDAFIVRAERSCE